MRPYGAVAPGRNEARMYLRARTVLAGMAAAMLPTLAMAQEFSPPATTSMTTTIDGLLVIGGAVALAFAVYSLFRRGTRKV